MKSNPFIIATKCLHFQKISGICTAIHIFHQLLSIPEGCTLVALMYFRYLQFSCIVIFEVSQTYVKAAMHCITKL